MVVNLVNLNLLIITKKNSITSQSQQTRTQQSKRVVNNNQPTNNTTTRTQQNSVAVPYRLDYDFNSNNGFGNKSVDILKKYNNF